LRRRFLLPAHHAAPLCHATPRHADLTKFSKNSKTRLKFEHFGRSFILTNYIFRIIIYTDQDEPSPARGTDRDGFPNEPKEFFAMIEPLIFPADTARSAERIIGF
jgi:hypothetical protein